MRSGVALISAFRLEIENQGSFGKRTQRFFARDCVKPKR